MSFKKWPIGQERIICGVTNEQFVEHLKLCYAEIDYWRQQADALHDILGQTQIERDRLTQDLSQRDTRIAVLENAMRLAMSRTAPPLTETEGEAKP